MTSTVVATVAFVDGIQREVYEEVSGHQYVLDDDGVRVYGIWLLSPEELVAPDIVIDRAT